MEPSLTSQSTTVGSLLQGVTSTEMAAGVAEATTPEAEVTEAATKGATTAEAMAAAAVEEASEVTSPEVEPLTRRQFQVKWS